MALTFSAVAHADSPESYALSPGKPFLKQIHAAWDDIHFIDGFCMKVPHSYGK